MDSGKITFSAELDEKGFAAGARNIQRQVHEITATVEQGGARIGDVFDSLGKKIAGVFAVRELMDFEHKIISVRSEMESLQISFETLAGSRLGKELYNDIKEFAATTPMLMGDLAKGAQTLLGFNIEAERVMPILRQIGDISMGDTQKFNSLALAFAQMSSTGKLMGQDLLQMINAGFNPLTVIAEKTGKTVAELKEEMSQGKITVEMVEDAFKAATAEGGKFNGMLAKQGQGMKGAIAQMEGAVQNALNDFGEAQEGILVDGIKLITSAIEHYGEIGKVILTVAAAYGSWKAAQMLVVAYQNTIATNQAAIEAQRVASLQAIIGQQNAEAAAEAGNTAALEANTAAKAANMTATDAEIAAIGRALSAKASEAAANLTAAETEANLAANRLLEAQNSTKYYEKQYQAALKLGDGEKIEAAENALNTAASNENAAAKAAQAAQDNVATAAKAKEAAATRLSSFQTQVDTTNTQANATSKGIFAAVTRSATAAMNGLKAAMASNPFGLALVAITSIIGALSLFNSETDESTEALDKLRDAALGEIQKLQTYRAVLENVSKTSNQYKNTMRDLNAMAEEYHVTLFTENDTVDELRDKYNELTEAIHANTAERLLSEAASKAAKDAMDKEKEAMDELMKDAKDASYYTMEEVQQNVDGVWVRTWDSVKHNSGNIREITSTTWNQISSIVMENARGMSDAFDESNERGEESVEELVTRIEKILKSLGATDKEIEGFHDDLYEYVKTSAKGFQEAYGNLKRSESQLEGYKRSMVSAKDITNDAIDGMNYEQLQDELLMVQKEIDKVNDKKINPSVDTSRLKVLEDMLQRIRDLMPGQLTEGSDSALEKRLRKLKEDRDSYTYGSTEWKAKNDDIRILSTTLNAHKKSYAENADKGSGAGEKTERRAAQLARQREEYLDEQRSQARELERGEFDLWSQTEQAAIDAMKDGNDKTVRQIKLDFEQRKEELRRQYEDLRREKWEADKRLWESNPANKDKAFTGKETDAKYDPTEEEKIAYAKQGLYAQQQYELRLESQKKANQEAISSYLKQWGDYSQKRQVIEEDSAAKIADLEKELAEATTDDAKAAAQARIDTVKAETEQELNELDVQYGKAKAFMIDLFEDASEKSVTEIDKIIKKYEALLEFLSGAGTVSRDELKGFGFTDSEIDKALKLDAEGIKGITDAVKGLKGELEGRSPWQAFTANLNKAIKNLKEANGDLSKIGKGLDGIGSAVSEFSPQMKQFASDLANIFDFDDSKVQSAIDGLEGLGTTTAGVGQIMSGDVLGGVMTTVNGISKMVDAAEGLFGADYSSYNRLVDQYDRLISVWDALIDRKSEYISMSYGAETIKVGKEALSIIEKQADAYRELGKERLNAGASGGSHSIGRRLADSTSASDWKGIADALGMTVAAAQNLIGTSRMTGLFDLTAEQIRALRENNQVWWAEIDEDVRKYLESIIENEEKWKEVQEQIMQQLTTTTKENVFSGFLDSLYDLADGSEEVMDDIAKNWQQMVNKMVVNNFIAGKFQEQLSKWYEKLYQLNSKYSEGMVDMAGYQSGLDALKAEYDGYVTNAEEQIRQFTELGIIKPIEEAADTSLITLDTIKDGWMNMLMDMSSDTEDWANDIAKLMTQALIQSTIFNEQWEQQQQEWLDRYEEALNDQTITDAQRAQLLKGLQEDQEAWVNDTKRKARQIMEITGYSGLYASEQSASVQAMERITVDQADELIGRMNAGQMIWEQGNELSREIIDSVNDMRDLYASGNRSLSELVSLHATSNQHLNNILTACLGIRSDMVEKMDDLYRIMNNKM